MIYFILRHVALYGVLHMLYGCLQGGISGVYLYHIDTLYPYSVARHKKAYDNMYYWESQVNNFKGDYYRYHIGVLYND